MPVRWAPADGASINAHTHIVKHENALAHFFMRYMFCAQKSRAEAASSKTGLSAGGHQSRLHPPDPRGYFGPREVGFGASQKKSSSSILPFLCLKRWSRKSVSRFMRFINSFSSAHPKNQLLITINKIPHQKSAREITFEARFQADTSPQPASPPGRRKRHTRRNRR